MKSIFYSLLFIGLVASIGLVSSCVDNSEEPTVDCANSDLSLTIKSTEQPGCETTGSVTLEAAGGSGGYTYSSNGIDFSNSATIGDLSAGNLVFTVKDADGCTTTVSTVLEGEANSVAISVDKTASDCSTNNGSVTITASGGDGTYSYSLDGGTSQSTNTFSSLGPGTYTIEVTDGTGCSASQEVSIDANISLANDIVPIITNNCAISGCHSGSVSPNLSSSSSIISNASNIKSRTGAETMPPASRPDLSSSDIALIACWVDAGAKNN